MIKINMFRASYGDSLLVQISEDEKESVNIMIDCGFNYNNNIRPKLENLLKGQVIDRFIITHFDSDHIQSAAKFLEENGRYNEEKIVKIEQIWLNTYKHLQFAKRNLQELNKEEKEEIENYLSGILSKSIRENNQGDIGAKQATTLGKKILEKKYPWNIDANGEAICIENLKEISISDNVKLHLLSPNKERLQNLESEFITELSKMGLSPNTDTIFDDAFELFNLHNKGDVSNEGNISSTSIPDINSRTIKVFSKGSKYKKDNSIGNGSSISFILETVKKKLLFLADAFAEDVIDELKKKYPDKSKYPMFFDSIKISHHGSFGNNSSELFKIIDSDVFLFSTNGKHPKHKHPDVETISCIINRELPENISKRTLVFNYELEHLEDFDEEELKTEFNYRIKIQVETEI